jgi:hypothetical protein
MSEKRDEWELQEIHSTGSIESVFLVVGTTGANETVWDLERFHCKIFGLDPLTPLTFSTPLTHRTETKKSSFVVPQRGE